MVISVIGVIVEDIRPNGNEECVRLPGVFVMSRDTHKLQCLLSFHNLRRQDEYTTKYW